jgi:hypothetical protein
MSVLVSKVSKGTILYTDDGFTCIGKDARREVQEDEEGCLWISCKCGRHYLDGQIEGDRYVGLTLNQGVF